MTGQWNNKEPLLAIRDLTVEFRVSGMWQSILEDINLNVYTGETVGLVGESGCGKSTTALSILGLLARETVRTGGEIRYRDRDLLALDKAELRRVRGAEIAMIPQDPYSALNPLFTIGNQIGEAIRSHQRISPQQLKQAIIDSLNSVRFRDPQRRINQYPHELSGGMRQRAVGAIATACGPALLIADEPTTALDATVQAEYLEMLRVLQDETGLSMIFITHDLGVVARVCDRVAVMYAGRIVESGTVDDIFYRPSHWYTRGLLACTPTPGQRQDRLAAIDGVPPTPGSDRRGCRFAGRCGAARSRCRTDEPGVEQRPTGHEVRCWYPADETETHA